MLKIIAISDTHNEHHRLHAENDVQLPDGDVVVHAGDFTNRGKINELHSFFTWYERLPHKAKIVISGNHDKLLQSEPSKTEELIRKWAPSVIYLKDSSVTVNGVKFYGSPWQPEFGLGWAFNLPRGSQELFDVWEKIPTDTNVLITHGPPFGYGDRLFNGTRVGCAQLRRRIEKLEHLKCHVFGHIHEDPGVFSDDAGKFFVNAAFYHRPNAYPYVIEIVRK